MPVNKFQGAKLTFVLSAAQTSQIRRAIGGPGPVCPCHTPATSTSCRLKFRTWPFLEPRLLLQCCIVTGAHASTRKKWALQCPSSSTLPRSNRPFCQTAISCGQSCGIFVRILSVDRPLYLSLRHVLLEKSTGSHLICHGLQVVSIGFHVTILCTSVKEQNGIPNKP